MSRIEKGSETKEEIQQMKGEVIKEISSRRQRKPWCACSIIFLMIIFGLLTAGVWAVAATGLVTIPGFTSFAYQTPEPERVVIAGIPIETIINQQAQTTLTERLQAGGGKLDKTSVVFSLDEQSLTASLRTLLEESGETIINPSGAQVTVSKEKGFTFFLPIENSVNRTVFQISVIARMREGTLELTPKSFAAGSLHIPNALTAFFLQPFIYGKLSDLNAVLGSYMEIKEITYEDGKAVVTGNFSVKIMNGQP
jgi:hypothetical protein